MAAATAMAKTRNGNSDEDDMPRLCLVAVANAVLVVVKGGRVMAMVEKGVKAAAEEVDDGQGGWRLCSVFVIGSTLVFI
jgi:hypothetical protein